MVKQNITHYGFNDSIAEILETFIILLLLVWTIVVERAVYQRLAIYCDVAGIESEYLAQTTGKSLVLTTQQIMDIVSQTIYMHGTMVLYYNICIEVTITKKAV